MFIKQLLRKRLSPSMLGAVSLAMLATTSVQLPASAQTPASSAESLQAENLQAESLQAESLQAESLQTENLAVEENAVELAQNRGRRRRRTRAAQRLNYVGVGADFGTADDTTVAVISKLSLTDNISVRPAALIGEDFSVIAPVTYDFTQFNNNNSDNISIRPYVGAGVSYINNDDDDNDDDANLGLLLSAGIDIPVSRRFLVNAQANYAGVFSDEENFGATVGVGFIVGR